MNDNDIELTFTEIEKVSISLVLSYYLDVKRKW